MTDVYAKYERLKFRRPAERILQIVLDSPGRLNATDARMHEELAYVWRDIDADPDIAVAMIRGAGDAFSAGGDLELVEAMANDFATRARVWREARAMVYNIIDCSKPLVSAMHGPAVGVRPCAQQYAEQAVGIEQALAARHRDENSFAQVHAEGIAAALQFADDDEASRTDIDITPHGLGLPEQFLPQRAADDGIGLWMTRVTGGQRTARRYRQVADVEKLPAAADHEGDVAAAGCIGEGHDAALLAIADAILIPIAGIRSVVLDPVGNAVAVGVHFDADRVGKFGRIAIRVGGGRGEPGSSDFSLGQRDIEGRHAAGVRGDGGRQH